MSPPGAPPLPSQRHLFDLPDEVAYLDCAYMSPQLRSVTEAGLAAVRRKAEPWRTEWFTDAEGARATAARLMGAEADEVALVPAASYGIAVAAANLPVGRGQNVVVLDEQFPSNVYAWRDRAREAGAELRTVRKGPDEAWTEPVLAAIDEGTAVVAVPNCHWTDGALVDLVAVGERARAVGAGLVVDASQSFGAYPIDVGSVRPDFLVSVGYKWQLGPYGLGYLYAGSRWRREGRPIERSWLARAGAEDFSKLVGYVDEYRPGARRFDMGEYPQFVLAPMARAGLEQILAWGVDRVQATVRRLTDRVAQGARELGCAVLADDRRVGHLVGLRFPRGLPPRLRERLAEERVHVSLRGDSIRVAPHVYDGEEDVDRLLAVLRGVT